jgi:hypothetical protein
LADFLDHVNSVHENIQFTMDTKRDDHLPFLDKPYGSLGHKVYCKPTYTPSSISMPTPNTNLLTNRLCFPCCCTGPEPCVITKACMISWSYSGALSGETVMATGRSDGL